MDSQRNRNLSQLLPLFFGLTNPNPNPLQESSGPDRAPEGSPTARDRIVLINPLTQGMVVIESGGRSSFDSVLLDLLSKDGQPPASKSSVLSLPRVEISDDEENNECVICLEELGFGDVAKEMPCKHRFHDTCINKWLGIHGSCPVCRFKMPTENGDDMNNKNRNRQRREIWVSFSFGGDRRSGETTPINSTSDAIDDEEMET